VDGRGVPLSLVVTAANRNDVSELAARVVGPLPDADGELPTESLCADAGYAANRRTRRRASMGSSCEANGWPVSFGKYACRPRGTAVADYTHRAHTVTELRYHLGRVTKYRYPVLRGEVALRAREVIRQVCEARELVIVLSHRPAT
jgi:hypothetical protein